MILKKTEEFVEILKKRHNIIKVILFGSYVNDTYSYGSDVDLFLVHDDKNLSFEKALTIALEISSDIDWQIHCYGIEDYKYGLNNNNPFFKTIHEHGLSIYDNEKVV